MLPLAGADPGISYRERMVELRTTGSGSARFPQG
jgi:hypothetical protein